MDELTDYITLGNAASAIPGRPSANAIWRWCRRGLKSRAGGRVHLKHVRVGGRIYTKTEWLIAFFEEVAEADKPHFESEPLPTRPRTRTEAQRRRAIEEAEATLRALGM